MHVCIVLENHPAAVMGGAEYQAHLLAEELASRPDVRATYLARSAPDNGLASYEIRQFGSTAGFRRRAVLFDSRSLWQALVDLQPDVIYQRMKQSYTLVGALYGRRNGVPFVFHAASEPDVDGRWLRKGLSPNLPLDLLDVAAGNLGVRLSSRVVVQTKTQALLLRRHFGREPAALVRNFQPLPRALPAKLGADTRILWVGNIKDVKRPELFLELASRFAGREDLQFWMVGRPGGNRGTHATMMAIEQCGKVRYFGELPLRQVNALMSEADIFVNTSSYEGSPNTFIQAWARGAIVASLTVDVDDGMDALGIGYRAGNMDALVRLIERLSRAPELRREVGERAFNYACREHSLDNAARLADLLISTAGRARDSSP